MTRYSTQVLKEKIYKHWNENPCNACWTKRPRYTKEYYDEIEKQRYAVMPQVPLFAQFGSFSGKKVLEVGVGLGTDFKQWVLAGAKAYGIDFTEEAIKNTKRYLEIYKLNAEEIRIADVEMLPYADSFFDLVYGWSVIQHVLDPVKALGEVIRVMRPGGKCKIMVCHRHSLAAIFFWIRYCLLTGRFRHSLAWAVSRSEHNLGTKAFTKKEIEEILGMFPLRNIKINTILSFRDLLPYRNKLIQLAAKSLASILGGDRIGFFMTVEFEKQEDL